MKLMVTGGRGFIGSHFVEHVLSLGHEVIDFDKMTYAGNTKLPFDHFKNYIHYQIDINDINALPECDVILNFAAESHVCNSITASKIFLQSNVVGVWHLLELLKGKIYRKPLMVQVSTDEVYGDIRGDLCTEENKLNPGNVYSASKSSAEMLVLAYSQTFDVQYVITRSSNNYGPRQYYEKLIPCAIKSLREYKKIPLHGDGTYIRDWIYVQDNVKAIYLAMLVALQGKTNEIYNIGCDNSLSNLEVCKKVVHWIYPDDNFLDHIEFVPNRMGQDKRYAIDSSKIKQLGWEPEKKELFNFL